MKELLDKLEEIHGQLLEIRTDALEASNNDHMVGIYAKDALREVNKLRGELLMHK